MGWFLRSLTLRCRAFRARRALVSRAKELARPIDPSDDPVQARCGPPLRRACSTRRGRAATRRPSRPWSGGGRSLVPPPLALEATRGGEVGSGSNGLCDPPPPAPPRRPRSRIGFARAAGERRWTRGVRGCAAPLGVKEEKSCCASTAPAAGAAGDRGPALVPPVDDAARGTRAARTPQRAAARRQRGSRANRPRRRASGRAPAAPRSQTPSWRVGRHRSTSSSRPSSSLREERWPARRGTPRSSSTPRSRCRGLPARSRCPARRWPRRRSCCRRRRSRRGHSRRRPRRSRRPARSPGWPTRSRPGRWRRRP